MWWCNYVVSCLLLVTLTDFIVCPPVTEKPPPPSSEAPPDEEDVNFGLEYERYLKEIVSVLEGDEEFRKKLEDSNISDIRSGEIAKHLDFVGHGIRTRLDEIKRKEVDRIRQIIRLQTKLQQGVRNLNALNINLPDLDKDRLLAHIDSNNPNTFEVEDLARLIKQATTDLEEIDEKRRSEFKNYELEKEVLRKKQLEEMDEQQRAEEERKFLEKQKKHADHPKVHHPGAEDQLKEVWEESDGLNKRDFDPKTFFFLHDTNGDGQLDASEIEALFQKELDKVYDPNAPEDDMVERYEEMNRMREHIMSEVDKNQDKMISLQEFIDSTKKSDFKKDEGWDTLEKQRVYTDEELAEFERTYQEMRRQQELERQGKPADHLQAQQQPLHAGGVNAMNQQGHAVNEKQRDAQLQQQPQQVPVDLPVHPRAGPV